MGELKIHRSKLKSINRQKSRELWLKAGDRNFKFFHISTIIIRRRRRNKINAILVDRNWLTDDTSIASYFGKKFEEVFTSNHPQVPHLEYLFPENIREGGSLKLMSIPTDKEIKDSVWNIHPLKSMARMGSRAFFIEATEKQLRKEWATS